MFSTITAVPLPEEALLQQYRSIDGGLPQQHYTDSFALDLDGTIRLADFVAAFYTTWLFKIERFILSTLVNKPSTDDQARELGLGRVDQFAAWRVEARAEDQILLCDFRGKTRSWLMVKVDDGSDRSRLYFGSAVIGNTDAAGNPGPPPMGYRMLLGFHRGYSRILLALAGRKIKR